MFQSGSVSTFRQNTKDIL